MQTNKNDYTYATKSLKYY